MDRLGAYDLVQRLGSGSVGEVWAAVHRRIGSRVAIKVLRPEWTRDPDQRAALRAELRTVAELSHPNIVTLLDQGETPDGAPWIAMEEVRGKSAQELRGQLEWPRVRAIFLDLLAALAHAHARGVLHRDLKPANVLVTPDRARLADFGIAVPVEARVEAATAGTPNYMAPEQVTQQWRAWGPWTDLYALGCLGWALCTGEAPFAGRGVDRTLRAQLEEAPGEFRPKMKVSPGLEAWLRTLLAKDPRDRFQLAAEARAALEALEGGGRVGAPTWQENVVTGSVESANLALFGLRATSLVGREAEQGELWSALRRVSDRGAPEVVLLSGVQGTGRSRLARWLGERAHELGIAHTARAEHGPTHGGLGPMVEASTRSAGLQGAERTEWLGAWLRRGGGEAADAPALAALIEGRDLFAGPEERFRVLHRWVRRMAAERPLVLILEDVAFGPEAIAFSRWLLEQDDGLPTPVLVLITASTEDLASTTEEGRLLRELLAQPQVRRIEVAPLEGAARLAFVQQVLALEPELAARVAERTGGHAQFTLQLLQDWVQRGLLRPSPAGLMLLDERAARIPPALDELWGRRLELALAEQPPESQEALQIAAALGLYVDLGEWADSARRAGITLPPGLPAALADRRLGRLDARGFTFSHPLLRERLERAPRRAQRHAACAAMLEARGERGERLGRHLVEAGRLREGVQVLLEAARAHADRGDAYETLSALRKVDSILPPAAPERVFVHLLGAQVHVRMGLPKEALADADAALRLSEDPLVQAKARILRATALRSQNENDEALRLLAEAAPLADAHGTRRDRWQWRREWAFIQGRRGNLAEARRVMLEGLAWLSENDALNRADSHLVLTVIAFQAGDMATVRKEALVAHEIAKVHGIRLSEAVSLNQLGEAARAEGRLEEAEVYYRQSASIFRAVVPRRAVLAEGNLALNLVEMGRFRDAEPVLRRLLRELKAQGREALFPSMPLALLPGIAAEGRWAEWAPTLAQGLALLRGQADYDSARCLEIAAEQAEAGRPDLAAGVRREATRLYRAMGREDRAAALDRKNTPGR